MRWDGTVCKYKLSDIENMSINDLIDKEKRFIIVSEDEEIQDGSCSNGEAEVY